ncbi:hypothetical protein C9439_02855 [archaeon SCG-AAA382B04]|nr:hypothetical protein C9439_02855 [archaeon SCG-AAA382B04]
MNLKLIDKVLNPLVDGEWHETKIVKKVLKNHKLGKAETNKIFDALLEIKVIKLNEKEEIKLTKLGKKILDLNKY